MIADNLEKIVKYYHENKISHAYLLETNNMDKCFIQLKCAIKKIICQNEYNDNCTKCNLCNLVDQNYLPSFVTLEPDGVYIKKEQILYLKKIFSMVPTFTKENIYVIKNAEKLNGSSANAMLKFLEEPDDNILGFFITNYSNNVISTIKSRCEIVKVFYVNNELDINSLQNDSYIDYFNVACLYLEKLEVEKIQGIMYNKDIILSKFKERKDIKLIFKIILIIYEELFNKVIGYENKFNFDNLNYLVNLNSNDVLKRINLVINFLEDIDSNVNIELLLDKFVIELGGYNE